MMRCILLVCSFLSFVPVQAQTDSNSFVHTQKVTESAIYKNTASEKLLVFQVLRLTNQQKEESLMVVFCETTIQGSRQRALLRSDYMLRRERIYLSNVFFSKVEVLEKEIFSTDIKTCLQLLELKYAQLRLWSILQSDLLFRN